MPEGRSQLWERSGSKAASRRRIASFARGFSAASQQRRICASYSGSGIPQLRVERLADHAPLEERRRDRSCRVAAVRC